MTRKKTNFIFEPGHVYFMDTDEDSGKSNIFDLSKMGIDRAADFLEGIVKNDKKQ